MSDVSVTDPTFTRSAVDSGDLPRSVLFAIRCVVTFLIAFTIVVTLTVFGRELTVLQSFLMTAIALSFLAWTLVKAPALIYEQLRVTNVDKPAPKLSRIWIYLIVQLILAELAISVASGTQAVLLLWLLLLPPASQSTIFLGRSGVFAVSILCITIVGIGLIRAFGWESLSDGLSQFGLILGIVVIVTIFMVRATKARHEAVRLAAELKFAYLRLRESAIQAEEFAAARERNRLAREIHDTIGHALTVVNVQLEVALTMLERDPAMARDAIGKSLSMVGEGLQEIRMSVSELRSSPLDNRSLVEALHRIVMELDTVECPVEFEVRGEPRNLAQKEHLCLFRAGQEGMTNSKRHSSATKISVTLDYSDTSVVSVCVKDNGIGSSAIREGFGLMGIAERSQEVGGAVEITTSAGNGFAVTVRVRG